MASGAFTRLFKPFRPLANPRRPGRLHRPVRIDPWSASNPKSLGRRRLHVRIGTPTAREADRPMTELARTRPETFFSDRFSVTSGLMERVLGGNLLGKVDDADIYLEYRINEELVLEEGIVKKASRHVSQGAGVRAQAGTRTGYAHTDEISVKNLEEAARQARAIADRSRFGSRDRKSTRLNSSHLGISYAVFCLKKKNKRKTT